MKMTGIYRIALLPGANEKEFVDQMVGSVFDLLQLTRVTVGFSHVLLKEESAFRQYTWLATVGLVGDDKSYDFDQNRERVQQGIAQFGLLIGVDTYTNLVER